MIGRIRRKIEELNPGPVTVGFFLGFIGAVALIIAVFATGSTFGQRCATITHQGSPEWHQCVQDLSEGKPVEGLK